MQVNKVFFGALYMFDLPQENSREAGQVMVVPYTLDEFLLEKENLDSVKNLNTCNQIMG